MRKTHVLFVCVENGARSQMAEAFLKYFAGDEYDVESAGFEPGELNPFVVEAMDEIGIDISANQTKSVFSLFKEGRIYNYVISCCDEAAGEKCPIFPGPTQRLHWNFEDPSALEGSREEVLYQTRKIRDMIADRIKQWPESNEQ